MNRLTPEGKDPQIWEIAQQRASFKKHLMVYVIMTAFFWLFWYMTGGYRYNTAFPWPLWPMMGWGVGIVMHYLSAFVFPKGNTPEEEYEKLIKEHQNG